MVKQIFPENTTINIENSRFLALMTVDVVVDLYQVLGPDGIVPLVKEF